MTPQQRLKHLKNEGDSTYTTIYIYLAQLNTFGQGHAKQDPSVNSKKKPDSVKEEKEEKKEREEEEEEVATASDGNDVSHEDVAMNACDHSKQGLESQTASEIHNDPELEVTDGCESSKNVPDDIDKDVTDGIGPLEGMGGSEHSQTEFTVSSVFIHL
jgi:hypothetical protein